MDVFSSRVNKLASPVKISILVIPNLSFEIIVDVSSEFCSFQFYLNRGMIRVAEERPVVALNYLRHIWQGQSMTDCHWGKYEYRLEVLVATLKHGSSFHEV